MKKFIALLTVVLAFCSASMSAYAFPILIGIPSTVSEGAIWIIAAVLLVLIIVGVVFIVKKNKITPWDFTKHKKARV